MSTPDRQQLIEQTRQQMIDNGCYPFDRGILREFFDALDALGFCVVPTGDADTVNAAMHVLWGFHEEAAECSHRPDHVRRLFIDANAAHRFATRLNEAGLLRPLGGGS